MNENIDLTKILEGLEGIELWSPITGYCILDEIRENNNYPIWVINTKESIGKMFSKEGKLNNDFTDAECLLFPSKEQRDWSKFVRPIKRGTPMMCSNKPEKNEAYDWRLKFYKGFYDKHEVYYYYDMTYSAKVAYDYIIPFDKFNPNDIEGSLKYNIQK